MDPLGYNQPEHTWLEFRLVPAEPAEILTIKSGIPPTFSSFHESLQSCIWSFFFVPSSVFSCCQGVLFFLPVSVPRQGTSDPAAPWLLGDMQYFHITGFSKL